jgi:hypothetical protein
MAHCAFRLKAIRHLMDLTDVVKAELEADSSFRKIRRFNERFKSNLSASHTQYVARILQMKRESILSQHKPLNYFDKKPSSIPPPYALQKQIFASLDSSSCSSDSSGTVEWPEFHEYPSLPKPVTIEPQQADPTAEIVQLAAMLKRKYPRAIPRL